MKITTKRSRAVIAVAAASTLALTACSNSTNEDANGGSGAGSTDSAYELNNAEGNLSGEGATSQQKAMELFGSKYSQMVPGATLSYNATGSGDGQSKFISYQAAFAGSDSPLKDDQIEDAKARCEGNDAWHLPMVIGPVAVAFNLEGVDDLNLTVDTVAKIFKGDITSWNDPEIAGANPEAELPDEDISVLYRSEESGTSDNFQKFLSANAPDIWDGEGKQFPSGVGAGANGSSGVADQVKATNGAITYVESGFASASGLGIANLDFGAGPVELTPETVNDALSHAEFKNEGHDLVVDTEALYASGAEGGYPLVLTTYEIVCSAGYDENTGQMVQDFLHVILDSQDDQLEGEGYIPLEGDFKQRLEDAVAALG